MAARSSLSSTLDGELPATDDEKRAKPLVNDGFASSFPS